MLCHIKYIPCYLNNIKKVIKIQETIETDVLVVGGGLSGVFAAIGAKRVNPQLRIWLVEKEGYCGGMATSGFVFPFMRYYIASEKSSEFKRLTAGLFKEMLDRLAKIGFVKKSFLNPTCPQKFDSYMIRCVLDEMLLEFGINILFHSIGCSVETVNLNPHEKSVSSVIIDTKKGLINFKPKYIIDATGDGDICYHAGAEFAYGRESDGLTQPATLNFRIGNISIFSSSRKQITKEIQKAKQKGLELTPRNDCLMFDTNNPKEKHFNQTRVAGFDFTDPFSLSKAEIEGRKQAKNFILFLKSKIRGFKHSSIAGMGNVLGVRESRRIIGEYVLTKEDLENGTLFDDRIALGNYPIDIHDPKGSASTELKHFGKTHFYSIPLRSMIVKGFSNLLVTGRAISATHEALSAIRIMPICAQMGESCGIFVGIVSAQKAKISIKEIDITLIQQKIKEFGGIID